MMPKWIKFVEVDLKDGRKTKVWCVWTTDGHHFLGRVGWYSPWRKYAFTPSMAEQVILEEQCLRLIASFCQGATGKRKEEQRRLKRSIQNGDTQ